MTELPQISPESIETNEIAAENGSSSSRVTIDKPIKIENDHPKSTLTDLSQKVSPNMLSSKKVGISKDQHHPAIIIPPPQKIKTPRVVQQKSNINLNIAKSSAQPLIDDHAIEEERKSMTNLRKSVEVQIQTMMTKTAEIKTDPSAADDEDENIEENCLLGKNEHEEEEIENADADADDDNADDTTIYNNKNEEIEINQEEEEELSTNQQVCPEDDDCYDKCVEEDENENQIINNNNNNSINIKEKHPNGGTTSNSALETSPNDDRLNQEQFEPQTVEPHQQDDKIQPQTENISHQIENEKQQTEEKQSNEKQSNKKQSNDIQSNDKQSNDEINNERNEGRAEPEENFLITQVDEAVEGNDDSARVVSVQTPDGLRVTDHPANIMVPLLDISNQPTFGSEEDVEQQQQTGAETGSTNEKKVEHIEPLFTQQEVEDAFIEFQKNRTLPQIIMRDALIFHIHSLSEIAIDEEDYDLAERLDKDLNDLITAFNNETARLASQSTPVTLENRLEDVKKQIMICEYEWDNRIKRLKESEKKKLEELENKQLQEREEFEAKCQTADFLQKFTKPSARLLQLWKLQKALALQHDFEGAKEMKNRADALQKKETDEAQQRAISSVKQNYEKLVVKQQRELECAALNGKRKIRQMESDRKKDLESKEKLTKQVESRMKEWRPPLKKSCLPPLSSLNNYNNINNVNSPSNNNNNNTNNNNVVIMRDNIPSSMKSKRAKSRGKRTATAQPEPTTVLDVKIANIRSVLGTRTKQPF